MAAAPTNSLLRPLRRTEYDQLVELGAFIEEHVELLDGALVTTSPAGPQHASVVQRLTELLVLRLAGRASVRVQSPFAAGPVSEPEPDLAVVPPGSYDTAHPDRAHLIVEVAKASLLRDLIDKARIYAECQVPEYWLVNLVERRLEVHRDPRDGAYRNVTVLQDGEATVTLCEFPDVCLRLDRIVS